MSDQPFHPENRENQDADSLSGEEGEGRIGTSSGVDSGGGEERRRRRHSSRSGDGYDPAKERRKGRHRSKSRNSETNHRITQRIMIVACCALALVGIFLVGFLFGQKAARNEASSHKAVLQETVFPLPENDALLDKGFHEMGDGDYRHAMMDFQKVKDNQPALTGTDYLIAVSAFKAGESIIAEDAANQAISKNETADGARVIIALINLTKAKDSQAEDDQFADPRTTAETEIHHLAATHPENAGVYVLWGDLLRSNGTFRSAVDIFHKGVLRALPDDSRELLSAKEQLARLQNESAKTAPSLSALTSMSAEQALVAAFSCLQLHRSDDAAVFLQRARDLYAPGIFLELMADQAFNDYHTDPALKGFFNTDSETSPPDEFPSKSATPDPTSTNPLSNASNPLSAP